MLRNPSDIVEAANAWLDGMPWARDIEVRDLVEALVEALVKADEAADAIAVKHDGFES